jgi:hypothetical protein
MQQDATHKDKISVYYKTHLHVCKITYFIIFGFLSVSN